MVNLITAGDCIVAIFQKRDKISNIRDTRRYFITTDIELSLLNRE